MAKTVDEINVILRDRLRATGTVAYTDAFMYDLISKAQLLVNAGLGRVKTTTTLTTVAYKLVYKIADDLTSAIDIISVKDGERTIYKLDDWRQLFQYNRDWFRATGTRIEAWAQIGRDLLILYPALTSGDSVTVYHTKLTDTLDDSTDELELPDEDIDLLLDVCEMVLHANLRQFDELKHLAERFKQDYVSQVASFG